ncbi:MAG: hypothetical protein IJX34_00850 [Clostridia bacterium]|nr:hypothetical protein [Clostridia bacterium]
MQKIPIKQPVAKYTRIANNLLNKDNAKIIMDMLLTYQKHVKDYNGEGREAAYKDCTEILDNFYRIIENTNCKENLIISHNNNYMYSKELSKLCSSEESIKNTGDSLKEDKSKDIVTSDFKKCLYACEDEKMQKVAFWANRLAHGCSDEIGTFAEEFLGASSYEEEAEQKRKLFLKRIFEANEKFREKAEFKFNRSRLAILIKKADFDFDRCTDPDFIKAKALMKESKVPCRDKEAIRDFIYCNKLQDMTNNFYAFKDNAIENLILYLNDPEIDEEDKHIVAFRIKDKKMKDKKGNSLSRIVLANKGMYERYLEFNDSVQFTDSHIDGYSDNKRMSISDKIKARKEIEKSFGDRNIDSNMIIALMEKCSISVFHGTDKRLDKSIMKYGITSLNENYSPVIECIAHNGGNIYDITPSPKKEDGLENYTVSQEEINKLNKEKWQENFESFCSQKKIERKAKTIVQEIENENNRRK